MTGEYLLRILIAGGIGAALGAEREYRDKAAGFRTIMLICIGSCLFTIFSQELITDERGDPTRITSSIVSGVGFLGAGVIFRRGRQSTGITTAATIWCAAALGMGAGGGLFALTSISALGILLVLWVLPPVERLIDHQRESKEYELRTHVGGISINEIHATFERHGLKVTECHHGRKSDRVVSEFAALGRHDHHAALLDELMTAEWLDELSS